MTLSGIDVSYAQGNIDWGKVKNHGIAFAYQKVNEGDIRDTTLSSLRTKEVRGTGIKYGGYDFLYPRPGRTGAQEFDIFYKYAKAAGLLKKGDPRPALDVETLGAYRNTLFGRYKVRKYVKSWVDRCVQVTRHHPVLYTAKWFYEDTIGEHRNHGCRLWVAAYTKNWEAEIPSAFDHAAFHQYTDQGVVPGINGHVDLDQYLWSPADFAKYNTLTHNV